MRTDQEIIDRIDYVQQHDWMGIERYDLIVRLPFETAKRYLDPEVDEADWVVLPRDRESVIAEMLKYMPFAWEKANDCRGLSASRSMSHYNAWVWLNGDDLGQLLDYEFYGKDNLCKICQLYGWDASQWDDGIRTNGDDTVAYVNNVIGG